ncbi:MAG TPA: hypothetical protein VIV61_08850 [Candidatus Ozemobacteraceae bacterium]
MNRSGAITTKIGSKDSGKNGFEPPFPAPIAVCKGISPNFFDIPVEQGNAPRFPASALLKRYKKMLKTAIVLGLGFLPKENFDFRLTKIKDHITLQIIKKRPQCHFRKESVVVEKQTRSWSTRYGYVVYSLPARVLQHLGRFLSTASFPCDDSTIALICRQPSAYEEHAFEKEDCVTRSDDLAQDHFLQQPQGTPTGDSLFGGCLTQFFITREENRGGPG